jgi:hypothetical protein
VTLTLTLPEPTVEVVAGRCTAVDVLLLNDGGGSQRVRLDVAGRAAPWVHITAPDGSDRSAEGWQVVGPGKSLTVSLRVSPPRGAAVPGQLVPFSVRATPPDSRRPAAAATGLVLISAPVPVTATLVPATSPAAGTWQHVVELSTDDPAGVLVTLRGTTSSAGATVTVEPVAVRVEPGSPARADVVVRPRRPAVWRTRAHPFEVVWETDTADGLARGAVTGRLDQPPVLPRAVTVLLLGGLLAVLGLGVATLWPSGEPGSREPAGGGQPATADPGQPTPLSGPLAVVGTEVKGADPAASRRLAEQRAAAVQSPRSTTAGVVDGSTLQGWDPDFWVLVVSGFFDVEAAQAFCDSRSRPDRPSSCRVVG